MDEELKRHLAETESRLRASLDLRLEKLEKRFTQTMLDVQMKILQAFDDASR